MSSTKENLIPLAEPYLSNEESSAVAKVLDSGWLVMGKEVSDFEIEFAKAVEVSHACAVSSGTAALHLSLLAAGIGTGDEVLTPSFTFPATANAIVLCGAKPVFCDIIPETFNVSPEEFERRITPRTKAIVSVHQFGMPDDIPKLEELASESNLLLIEDAACALGSYYRKKDKFLPIGSACSLAACFSLHPRKVITTGEGGIITTNDPDFLEKVRLLRNHGMASPDKFTAIGFNYRMTDIQAAIGRVQLRKLNEIISRRRKAAEIYFEGLGSLKGLFLPHEPEYVRTNWQSFCIRLQDPGRRDPLTDFLNRNGVGARIGITPTHLQAPYRGDYELPSSEVIAKTSLFLPLYPGITPEQQKRIIELIKSFWNA